MQNKKLETWQNSKAFNKNLNENYVDSVNVH